MAESTAILKCECQSAAQDKIYGPQIRLHNKTAKNEYRCTVCLRSKTK